MDQRKIAEEPSRPWRGLTLVVSLAFGTEIPTGDCTLLLDLAAGQLPGAQAVSIRFDNVVGLRLQDFGGGLTQLLGLDVRDVSDRQWDRQAYEVFDDEDDAIFFRCQSYGVVRQYTI